MGEAKLMSVKPTKRSAGRRKMDRIKSVTIIILAVMGGADIVYKTGIGYFVSWYDTWQEAKQHTSMQRQAK